MTKDTVTIMETNIAVPNDWSGNSGMTGVGEAIGCVGEVVGVGEGDGEDVGLETVPRAYRVDCDITYT